MKNAILFFILCCGIGSCSVDQSLTVCPGTYVRQSAGQFGTIYDTIVIKLHHLATKQYQITHRWKIERNLANSVHDPSYHVEMKSGIFDDQTGILTENGTMDHFSFDEKRGLLFNGPNVYQKIN